MSGNCGWFCRVQDLLGCPAEPGEPGCPPVSDCCGKLPEYYTGVTQCSGMCPIAPNAWWPNCRVCFPCVVAGGGGNIFNYIPPIGASKPPGNLYYYSSPETVTDPDSPNVEEVYPFIPGTLVPWCPGQPCSDGAFSIPIVCPQKCSDLLSKWANILGPPPPCSDRIDVHFKGWKLNGLFSSSLVSGGISLDTLVPRQRYAQLADPNLMNKNIGSNPIRSLGSNGWFVANTRGMGSSLYLKEVANIDHLIYPIKSEWYEPMHNFSVPGDYLQVAVGSSYGTIIHSNAFNLMDNLIDKYTLEGSTGLNEPDYSSLFFWPIPSPDNQVADNGLLRDDKKIRISARNYKSPFSFNEFNIPYYISSATTAAGDVFATLWSNTDKNPYRSFGMNLYYLKDDPSSSELNGITWQLNGGGTAQNQAYGIRPDLILWKFAHQLYPQLFTIGYTGCSGFANSDGQCDGREWFGFMGQTFMEACDPNQTPTSLYYKQVSLSDDFALVTLAHYEPEYDQEPLQIDNSNIHDVGRQVWQNRREQARWLFMISTTDEYRTVPLENTERVMEHSILDSVNNEVPTRLLTFDGNDNIYHYGLTLENGNHIKIPDHDNDVCRFCTTSAGGGFGGGFGGGGPGSGGQTENNYIINPLACMTSSLSGFTSCFKEEIEFGDTNHPIWNTKTGDRPDMPYVYVLDALAHAKTFNSDAVFASWDWIDATTLKAVLSWTDSTTHEITKKFVKLYEGELPLESIKIGAVEAIVQQGSILEQNIENLTYCDESINVTWSPCQVTGWGRSLDQSIFYMKTLPYVSWYEAENHDLIANTYNTLAKTVQVINVDYKIQPNATIGDPIPVYYTSKQNTTNRNFNRRFSYPSGYDYFQSEIYAIAEGNTYPFLIEDWLTNPDNTVILGSPYSDFSSSDGFNSYTQQWPSIPYWLRNYWLPSWTPKYPVIAKNNTSYARINNIYNNKMPYNCDTCKYDGTAGCCKTTFLNQQTGRTIQMCETGVPKTQCCLSRGDWNPGACSSNCVACNQINSDPTTEIFGHEHWTQFIEIDSSVQIPLCLWNAAANTNWFSIGPIQGTDNQIEVTVDENSSGSVREGDITITQNDITKIITIKQDSSPSACCKGIICTEKTFLDCISDSGTFKQGIDCSSNPCTAPPPPPPPSGPPPSGPPPSGPPPSGPPVGGGKDCCDYFIGPCCQYLSACEYETPQGCREIDGIFLGFNQTCDNCPS